MLTALPPAPEADHSPAPIRIALADDAATDALGARLAAALRPGDILALEGDLGAGKTHLARAIIHALQAAAGALPEDVPSPSYTLVQSYVAGPAEILHADLYRLGGPDEALELGLAAAFETATICLIEWPDRLGEGLPPRALRLALHPLPPQGEGRLALVHLPPGRDDLAAALSPLAAPPQPGGHA